MTLTPEQFEQIHQVFLRVRDLPLRHRQNDLEKQPLWLRNEVTSLLSAADACGSFLESDRPISSDTTTIQTTHESALSTLEQIGPYRIVRLIGEGGFGSVYLAEQLVPIQRRVAIKLIKPGMDSKQVLHRFQAERQALAMMDHSAIAKVLDAGTTESGAPYFVMELVQGTPIDAYCRERQLSLNQRLNLFVQVCEGVHHAHQKGVIHRDIKPSNILVADEANRPIVKVIDFGIAKALDSRLSDDTVVTQLGQMIGTLEYMSPEQADMTAVDVDTRSDVYSLGVLLYVLLTGTPPIPRERLLKNGLYEIPMQLQNAAPKPPSTQSETLRSTSSDLDWITLKALAIDRDQRYDSTKDFAADVKRYLRREPVSAHPPSLRYRLGKSIRRNRVAAVVVAALCVGLIVGTGGLAVGWRQASLRATAARTSQRQQAEIVYPQMLQLAWQAVKQYAPERCLQLLANCPKALRGWEWHFVQNETNQGFAPALRNAKQAAITELDYDEHHDRLACVVTDGSLEVRHATKNKLVHAIKGSFRMNVARWSPDGRSLCVGTNNGAVTRYRSSDWSIASSKKLAMGGIYDLRFSQNGTRLAVCTGGADVVLLDSETLEQEESWKLPARLSSILVDRGGRTIVGAGHDGSVYRCVRGEPDFRSTFVCGGMLRGLSWYATDTVCVLTPKSPVLVDVERRNEAPVPLNGSDANLSAVAVSSDQQVLLAGTGGSISKWQDKQTVEQLYDLGFAITDCVWLDMAGQLLVALSDGRLLRLDAAPQVPGWTHDMQSDIAGTIIAPKHQLAMVLDQNGVMHSFDLQTGRPLSTATTHKAAGWAVSMSDDQQVVASVGEDRKLRISSLPSMAPVVTQTFGWGVRDVAVAADGSWVAAGPPTNFQEGTIGIWNPSSGECERTLEAHGNWVVRFATSTASNCLVSSDVDGVIHVWDTTTWEEQLCIDTSHGVPELLAIDDTQHILYVGHRDGWMTSWDLHDGSAKTKWQAFGDGLSGLAITSDNRILATSRSDNRLKVIHAREAAPFTEFDLNGEAIQYFTATKAGYIVSHSQTGRFSLRHQKSHRIR